MSGVMNKPRSAVFSVFTIIAAFYQFQASNSQQCVSSPPELEFSRNFESDESTIYSASLHFDAKRFTSSTHGYPSSFTSRVYNDMLPGPTIRFQRGQTYQLTFYNDLGPEHPNDPGISNTFHWPNTTNLHTHGLHISPESPSDDAFLTISPGGHFTYTFHIPCNHNGGTNFYHPHHHGNVALQVGGGAAGALIIEDDDGKMEQLPQWLLSMNELVLMVQYMDLINLRSWTNLNYDQLTQIDGNPQNFYLINGKYQPSICLTVNEWKRLRIIYSDVSHETQMKFADSSVCSVRLLAKDGVYLSELPRVIRSNILYFTQSSRVDVAIKCNKIGSFLVTSYDHQNRHNPTNVNAVVIADLLVSPSGDSSATSVVVVDELKSFKPNRPRYLQSLLNFASSEVDNFWSVSFASMMNRYTINGELFSGADRFQMEVGSNEVNEWTVRSSNMMSDMHPLHVHVNHFQLMSGSVLSGSDPNMTVVGDWIDTVGHDARIRFWSDTFGEKIILHCHILDHEDLGMMTMYRIRDGCDALDFECIDQNTRDDCAANVRLFANNDGDEQEGRSDQEVEGRSRGHTLTVVLAIVCGVALCLLMVFCVVWRNNYQVSMKKKTSLMQDQRNKYDSVSVEMDAF